MYQTIRRGMDQLVRWLWEETPYVVPWVVRDLREVFIQVSLELVHCPPHLVPDPARTQIKTSGTPHVKRAVPQLLHPPRCPSWAMGQNGFHPISCLLNSKPLYIWHFSANNFFESNNMEAFRPSLDGTHTKYFNPVPIMIRLEDRNPACPHA